MRMSQWKWESSPNIANFCDSSNLQGEVCAGFDPLCQLQLRLLLQGTQILHPDVTMY